ncbi:MAG TPA: ABC transporter permease [bacterium]|nr:ABC transporter permease [bacterium]
MLRYVARRAVGLIPLLLAVATVTFFALELTPGDPAVLIMGQDVTPEGLAELRRQLGLDRPLLVQYARYLGGIARGDLGRSFRTRTLVTEDLARTFPVTLTLAVGSIVVASVVGVGAGTISAARPHGALDYVVRAGILTAVSAPVFWMGLVLIYWFSIRLGWLPVSGWGSLRHLVLPVVALSAFPLAGIARMTRSSVLDALAHDYVRTARAKGVPGGAVLRRHVMKNALIPVVTVIALQFGILLGGAVITETVFALPGLGQLVVTAVLARDYATIRGSVLLVAVSFALINLAVDVAYAALDPRIRYS